MTLEAHASVVAHQISVVLGETRLGPRRQIWRLVSCYGIERCLQWQAEALAVEQQGGELTAAGVPRTRGGIFFALVRRTTRERRRWRWRSKKSPRVVAALPSFEWQERRSVVAALDGERGVIETVKLTLIGRPGKVVRFKECVITLIQPGRGPSLPRGLPAISPAAQPYIVYINRRQWDAVAGQLADPDQVLVIDGWVSQDSELAAIVVHVLHVQVELSQAAKNRQKGTSA